MFEIVPVNKEHVFYMKKKKHSANKKYGYQAHEIYINMKAKMTHTHTNGKIKAIIFVRR